MSLKVGGPRLGRGLAALMGESALASAVVDGAGVRQVPIDLLDAGPFQPRGVIDPAALEELAASIRGSGILQPLLARPHPVVEGRFQIIAGERRWRAAAQAGLHDVPVLVRAMSDADAMAAALVENLQRQDLNALEEAEGYTRLLDEFGMTQEALAQAVGKSRGHVNNTIRLLKLPDAVQQALREGKVTAGHARALLAHPAPEAALGVVLARGLSVRQTEAMAARKVSVESAPAPPDPNRIALERELSQALGLRVEIAPGARGGSVRVYYQNLDQLDGFLSRLRGSLVMAGQ